MVWGAGVYGFWEGRLCGFLWGEGLWFWGGYHTCGGRCSGFGEMVFWGVFFRRERLWFWVGAVYDFWGELMVLRGGCLRFFGGRLLFLGGQLCF